MRPTELRAAVVGDGGLLNQAIAERLTSERLASGRDLRTHAVLLTVSDGWESDAAHDRHRRRALASGVPWLPVWTEGARALIGPLVRPDAPGCHRCLRMRRAHAREDWPVVRAVRERYATEPEPERSPLLTTVAAEITAHLVAARLMAAAIPSRELTVIGLRTLDVSSHTFLPDPCCPECGGLPDDSPQAAPRTLRPRPK
ncbi:TOMM precursor leader peptide-binding protein, partial [Streptomyces milbemycinicus]